ncbi:MAG: CcmD family protein [Anaerolineae bacterium]|nr:CcmD family protein [Anaerolineae bacterium]
MVYLAAAYAVFWFLTFALVFSMFQRQRNLSRQVEELRRAVEERREGKGQA